MKTCPNTEKRNKRQMKAKRTWKWKVGLGDLFRKYRMWFECPCDRGILFRLFFYTADMVLGSMGWTRGGRTEMKSQESAVSQRAKPTMSNCGGKVHGYCFWTAFGRCCVDKKPPGAPRGVDLMHTCIHILNKYTHACVHKEHKRSLFTEPCCPF